MCQLSSDICENVVVYYYYYYYYYYEACQCRLSDYSESADVVLFDAARSMFLLLLTSTKSYYIMKHRSESKQTVRHNNTDYNNTHYVTLKKKTEQKFISKAISDASMVRQSCHGPCHQRIQEEHRYSLVYRCRSAVIFTPWLHYPGERTPDTH